MARSSAIQLAAARIAALSHRIHRVDESIVVRIHGLASIGFFKIADAVAVGIGIVRIGPEEPFQGIGQTIAVRIHGRRTFGPAERAAAIAVHLIAVVALFGENAAGLDDPIAAEFAVAKIVAAVARDQVPIVASLPIGLNDAVTANLELAGIAATILARAVAIVAFLAEEALDRAVAALFEAASGAATVVGREVAVVAFLGNFDLAVAAGEGKFEGPDIANRRPVAVAIGSPGKPVASLVEGEG